MPRCDRCGHLSAAAFKFCPECGAPLVPAGREARKTVTVLFCDVVGSTDLGERLDPESLRQVLSRYFEAARAVVERHGGSVEKFIGDAVMAVFGAPVVHEDDALRAVRAASELREALGPLNEDLARTHGTTARDEGRDQHRPGRHGHRRAARDRRRGQRGRPPGADRRCRRDPARRDDPRARTRPRHRRAAAPARAEG